MSTLEKMGIAASVGGNVGAVLGGLSGAAVMIWASVVHIQPALKNVNGISGTGASWITVGINFLGGLEVAAGFGALVGMLTFTCLSPCLVGVGSCISKIENPFRSIRNSHTFSGVFSRSSHAHTNHDAPSSSHVLQL